MNQLFTQLNCRANSVALCGGAFGDEGKGRIVDEFVSYFLKNHSEVIQYRDNGGANAGHTVAVGRKKIALHQIGSGILQQGAVVISGKGMVIHPQDLVSELEAVKKICSGKIPATYYLDDMAVLCLDTHRALENQFKAKTTGGARTATGRGISPAYADIINRIPLRARDLNSRDWPQRATAHYQLYDQLIRGLGAQMSQIEVPSFNGLHAVGDLKSFLKRLEPSRLTLLPYLKSMHSYLDQKWASTTPFVFEKAQAIGLDSRYGTYPDVTASDCTFQGILSSTEGLIDPTTIAVPAAVIKLTYMSSVGSRRLPSSNHHLTDRIRQDAHEFGATTGRPRNIHYLDLPLLAFLMKVGQVKYLCPTHLDIAYPDEPIKVVVAYTDKSGKKVPYRPDQDYLLSLKPVFKSFPSWDGTLTQKAKTPQDLPQSCQKFLNFVSKTLNVKLLLGTTGPKRHQTIYWF